MKQPEPTNQFAGIELSEYSRTETAHHRVETRKVWAVTVAALGGIYKQEEWVDIQTIVIVERFRYLWNATTHEVQFYLSSLPVDAKAEWSRPNVNIGALKIKNIGF